MPVAAISDRAPPKSGDRAVSLPVTSDLSLGDRVEAGSEQREAVEMAGGCDRVRKGILAGFFPAERATCGLSPAPKGLRSKRSRCGVPIPASAISALFAVEEASVDRLAWLRDWPQWSAVHPRSRPWPSVNAEAP